MDDLGDRGAVVLSRRAGEIANAAVVQGGDRRWELAIEEGFVAVESGVEDGDGDTGSGESGSMPVVGVHEGHPLTRDLDHRIGCRSDPTDPGVGGETGQRLEWNIHGKQAGIAPGYHAAGRGDGCGCRRGAERSGADRQRHSHRPATLGGGCFDERPHLPIDLGPAGVLLRGRPGGYRCRQGEGGEYRHEGGDPMDT